MESIMYIQNYQSVYKNVLKRQKGERQIDLFVTKNRNKALRKIINKEIGNSHHVSNITINTGAKIITNPQAITERFNIYFTELIEEFYLRLKINALSNTCNFK
jgi:hypothetical protein